MNEKTCGSNRNFPLRPELTTWAGIEEGVGSVELEGRLSQRRRRNETGQCRSGKKRRLTQQLRKPFHFMYGGAEGDRTPDLLNAIQALSHLSYGPIRCDLV